MVKKFDGYRGGGKGIGGFWIAANQEAKFQNVEEWWRNPGVDGKKVPLRQYDPNGPKDLPIWRYKGGDMYLGPWKINSDGTPVEHGYGILFKNEPSKYKGLVAVGDFRNGFLHGKGKSFWLNGSLTWKKNHFPGSPILQDDDNGRWSSRPLILMGKFYRGMLCDKQATVVLKDKTARMGHWFNNDPVGNWIEHPQVDFPEGSFAVLPADSPTEETAQDSRPKRSSTVRHIIAPSPDIRTEETAQDPRRSSRRSSTSRRAITSLPADRLTEETAQNSRPKRCAVKDTEVRVRLGLTKQTGTLLDSQRRKRKKPTPIVPGAAQNSTRRHPSAIHHVLINPATPPAVHPDGCTSADSNSNSSSNSSRNSRSKNSRSKKRKGHSSGSSRPRNQRRLSQEEETLGSRSSNAHQGILETEENGLRVVPESREESSIMNDSLDERKHRLCKWIMQVIGNDPIQEEMGLYASRFIELGLHSITMIQSRCTAEHVAGFDWMKEFHKEAFLENAHLKK